jgi:hypothetical protein
MDILTRISWGLLMLLHLPPALPVLMPSMIERLYGVPATGAVGLLLLHRSVLFALVALCAGAALVHEPSRRLASVLLAVSMLGFLTLYAKAGFPAGPLRGIALADLAGVPALVFVLWRAWR